MNETKIIAPGEAWETVERLRISIGYNSTSEEWCASPPYVQSTKYTLGWGATPLEAVGNLLVRIGEAADKQANAMAGGV